MFGFDDALALGGPLVGGLIGNAASSGDRDSAMADQAKNVQQWLDLHVPDPAQQQVVLQKFVQSGQLSPAVVSAVQQGKSNLAAVQPDQGLQGSQLRALSSLQNEGLSGGLNLQDQATLQQQINDSNAAARGRNQAIMSQYAQQGLGGSGLQLQAQMGAAQNANQNQAMNSLNAAAQSRARALQATMGAGQLGGQMQQQQYGMQANAANAQDMINRFNAQNAQSANNQNAAYQNQANMYNTQTAQNVSNANTNVANQQEMYNKGLIQQQYNNQLAKNQGLGGAYLNQSNAYNKNADATANMWSNIGGGVGKAGAAMGQNNLQDEWEE